MLAMDILTDPRTGQNAFALFHRTKGGKVTLLDRQRLEGLASKHGLPKVIETIASFRRGSLTSIEDLVAKAESSQPAKRHGQGGDTDDFDRWGYGNSDIYLYGAGELAPEGLGHDEIETLLNGGWIEE
jgi:hypothetical protein